MKAEIEDESVVVVDATSADRKSEWTIRLEEDWIRGQSKSSDDGFAIRRGEFVERASVIDGLLAPRVLIVKKPKVSLRFDLPAFQSLKDWVGQASLLVSVLKQRIGFAIAIGGAFLFLSIPIAGDAAAGVEAIPFQPLLAALGVVLILEGLIARWRPHRHLLLVDSAFFVCLGAWNVHDVVGGAGFYWAILGAIQFRLAYVGVRDWLRFRRGKY